jgi:hypothetical protein
MILKIIALIVGLIVGVLVGSVAAEMLNIEPRGLIGAIGGIIFGALGWNFASSSNSKK